MKMTNWKSNLIENKSNQKLENEKSIMNVPVLNKVQGLKFMKVIFAKESEFVINKQKHQQDKKRA